MANGAADPNSELIQEPGEKDILFGRGKKFQVHAGNRMMRELLDMHKTQYHSLKRFQKQPLVVTLYKKLVDDGFRFLQKIDNTNCWIKADSDLAMQKVCHALRCKKQWERDGKAPPSEKSGVRTSLAFTARKKNNKPKTDGRPGPLVCRDTPQPSLVEADKMTSSDALRLSALNRYRALASFQINDIIRRERLLAMWAMEKRMQNYKHIDLQMMQQMAGLYESAKGL